VARGLSAAALALLILAGCAKTPSLVPEATPARGELYVLLPGRDGTTGAVEVTHGGQARVLDQPYAAARIVETGRVETGRITEAEVKQVFGETLAAQPERPVSFTLYFLEGTDDLTPESRQVLPRILAEIERRPAPEIVVTGHTDRVGTVPFNDALSLQRARKIEGDLVQLGVPASRIEVAGRGEREPLVQTPDEMAEPKNRRVEIRVR
jgi:outer membrane protein OmpA-like peptidoglycan-associated protein